MRILGPLFAISLTACDNAPAGEPGAQPPIIVQASDAVTLPEEVVDPANERPAFNLDEVDAEDLLDEVRSNGSFAGAPTFKSSRFDSFSGGHAISRSYRRGSVDIYTRPDGKVWRTALGLGWGDDCYKGRPEPIIRAFVDAFAPDVPESDRVSAAAMLTRTAINDQLEKMTIGKIRFSGGGGECVDRLMATAEG